MDFSKKQRIIDTSRIFPKCRFKTAFIEASSWECCRSIRKWHEMAADSYLQINAWFSGMVNYVCILCIYIYKVNTSCHMDLLWSYGIESFHQIFIVIVSLALGQPLSQRFSSQLRLPKRIVSDLDSWWLNQPSRRILDKLDHLYR